MNDPLSDVGASERTSKPQVEVWRLAAAFAFCPVVTGLGGILCGMVILRFGAALGALALAALGYAAGFLGKQILGGVHRAVGIGLAVANGLAVVVAEVYWIRWGTKQGADGWWASFSWLGVLIQEYPIDAAIAAIGAVVGAVSAYQWTAVRYRVVYIADD